MRQLQKVLVVGKAVISKNSVLMICGFGQHLGAGWNSYHALRYHMYVNLKNDWLERAVVFSYENVLGLLAGLTNPDADKDDDYPEQDSKPKLNDGVRYDEDNCKLVSHQDLIENK